MKIYTAKVYKNRGSQFSMRECDAKLALNILKGRTNAGEATIYFGDELVGRRWKLTPSERTDSRRKYGWFFDHDDICMGGK